MNESKTITAAARDDCNAIAAVMQDLTPVEKIAAMSYINGIKDANRINGDEPERKTA